VDVLVELEDCSKVNIELQIKMVKDWDKRELFYLAKLFTGDLLVGEDYSKLKKCICVSILDFNLDERPEYHKVYRLRDEQGYEFSDMFEIHIIELRKQLNGDNRVNEWIELINAESKEEMDMMQARTSNPGILAAIKEMKVMGLGKNLRMLYEARMKEMRDRNARDAYVYDEGKAEGKAETEDRMQTLIAKMIESGEADKLPSLVEKAFLEEMYRKYEI